MSSALSSSTPTDTREILPFLAKSGEKVFGSLVFQVSTLCIPGTDTADLDINIYGANGGIAGVILSGSSVASSLNAGSNFPGWNFEDSGRVVCYRYPLGPSDILLFEGVPIAHLGYNYLESSRSYQTGGAPGVVKGQLFLSTTQHLWTYHKDCLWPVASLNGAPPITETLVLLEPTNGSSATVVSGYCVGSVPVKKVATIVEIYWDIDTIDNSKWVTFITNENIVGVPKVIVASSSWAEAPYALSQSHSATATSFSYTKLTPTQLRIHLIGAFVTENVRLLVDLPVESGSAVSLVDLF
jgi:hypothetical protein